MCALPTNTFREIRANKYTITLTCQNVTFESGYLGQSDLDGIEELHLHLENANQASTAFFPYDDLLDLPSLTYLSNYGSFNLEQFDIVVPQLTMLQALAIGYTKKNTFDLSLPPQLTTFYMNSDLIETFDMNSLASCAESLQVFQIMVDQPLVSVTLSDPTLTFPKLSDLIIHHEVTSIGSLTTFDIDLKNAFPVLDILDLTGNLISALPDVSWTGIKILEMRDNRIAEIPANYLRDTSLSYLGLDYNLVQSLGSQSLYKPPQVYEYPMRILLSYNDLQSLDTETFRESLTSDTFTDMTEFWFDGNANLTSLDEDVFGPLLLHESQINGDSMR